MVELLANSGDPDQTPRSSASDLGLHCLPITLLGVSRLQWVNNHNIQYSGGNMSNNMNVNLRFRTKIERIQTNISSVRALSHQTSYQHLLSPVLKRPKCL